jgi:hypothetical protein
VGLSILIEIVSKCDDHMKKSGGSSGTHARQSTRCMIQGIRRFSPLLGCLSRQATTASSSSTAFPEGRPYVRAAGALPRRVNTVPGWFAICNRGLWHVLGLQPLSYTSDRAVCQAESGLSSPGPPPAAGFRCGHRRRAGVPARYAPVRAGCAGRRAVTGECGRAAP